ncbi:MAG: type II secretion system F family protein [Candidatus Diapherotrites archaeon]|nr:type II secretion system F family protein [Candidatus Diapherotrites archaeon]
MNVIELLESEKLKQTLLVVIASWFVFGILLEPLIGLVYAIIVGVVFLFAKIASEKRKTSEANMEIEYYLPFALNQIAIELSLGSRFEDVIKSVANSGYGILSDEFKKAQKELELGATLQEALFGIAENYRSLELKRAIMQLIAIYEQGRERKNYESLKKLSEDMIAKQQIKAKELSNKVVLFSLAFIALSALIPAMFQAYLIIGSFFMEITISKQQIFLIITVFFPALDAVLLLLIRAKTNTAFTSKKVKKYSVVRALDELLRHNYERRNAIDFVKLYITIGLTLSLAFVIAVAISPFELPSYAIAALAACIASLPLILALFYQLYKVEKIKLRKEAEIPEMLLQAASFPKGIPTERIIEYLGRNKTLLGREFEIASIKIKKNSNVDEVLEEISKRNRSEVISRAIKLLLHSYKTGADMSECFRETAKDIMNTMNILKERAASILIERYTLLLAGGLIVPLILGLLTALVCSFGAIQPSEFGLSNSEGLLETLKLATQIYIAEYAVLASGFVALQESKPRKCFVYAAVLLPASMLSYLAGKAITFCKSLINTKNIFFTCHKNELGKN